MRHRAAATSNGLAAPLVDVQRCDPWHLVWGQPFIDSERLAAAIEYDLCRDPEPNFRTRLLIRDAARGLRSFWGRRRFARWLKSSPQRERIQAILDEDLGKPGFPHIRRRLVSTINGTQLKQIFDLLGRNVHERVEVYVAGSIPTLILGLSARPTADIDLVNEVPGEIRRQHKLLERIRAEYGLTLGHVQSHYLPANWQHRRKYFGDFGGLRVYLVDPVDIFLSKLSSKQEKHQQDLRVLAQKIDAKIVRERLFRDGKAILEDPFQRPQLEANWQFIFQEPLVEAKSQPVPGPGEGEGTAAARRRKSRKRPPDFP